MKSTVKRQKVTIEVWNVCECGEVLDSIHAGKRGTCGACWIKSMPDDTRKALNRMIGAAFRKTPPTENEKSELVDEAMKKLERDGTAASGERRAKS